MNSAMKWAVRWTNSTVAFRGSSAQWNNPYSKHAAWNPGSLWGPGCSKTKMVNLGKRTTLDVFEVALIFPLTFAVAVTCLMSGTINMESPNCIHLHQYS